MLRYVISSLLYATLTIRYVTLRYVSSENPPVFWLMTFANFIEICACYFYLASVKGVAITGERSSMMYERGCLVLLSLFLCANPQFVLDRLSPYEEDFHGSLHRSVRSVAECQSKEWGNTTYDNYDLQIPVPKSVNILYDVHRFSDKVESNLHNIYSVHRRRYLMGSIAFLKDPYYAVSVLEPLKPSGCQIKYYSASRGTVRNTVHNRVNGCTVAVNAGYFSMKNGRCLGNVVSDGRIVQVSNEMNANFGIRQDGSVVVGYISTEEVRTGSFRQLVSGVIWLVRNGRNNVNESMKVECAANQNTGKMATFVNVLSARTALGLDKDGRVVVAHVSIYRCHC